MIDSNACVQMNSLLLIHKQPNYTRSAPKRIKSLSLPRKEDTRPCSTLKLSPENPFLASYKIVGMVEFDTSRQLRQCHPAAASSADHCANQAPVWLHVDLRQNEWDP